MEYLNIILISVSLVLSLVCMIVSIIVLSKLKNTSFSGLQDENIRREVAQGLATTRTELNARMDSVQNTISSSVSEGLKNVNTVQQNSLTAFSDRITGMVQGIDNRMIDLRKTQDEKLEAIRNTTETKIGEMQQSNQKKLDEMQEMVNDKLQKSLNEKVSESFKLVSEQLNKVYEGLGEMQTLATGVGDLKKILSNVKTRGVFGEIQLSRILEQIMTSEQYATNVITKKGSNDRVEFAIKLPAKNDYDEPVLLPIDSKFPMDIYSSLSEAYESGDDEAIRQNNKTFEACIKKNAKDIRDKYIDPPNTTDFAMMFMPTEGLYAEVTKRTELIEELARVYHVNVAGPSTISAFLNSLQMGFRTLAIEKRSHEVWILLSAVKTEFLKFADTLDKVKTSLSKADKDLDALVGTRTRAVIRKLKDVETLPEVEATTVLGNELDFVFAADEEEIAEEL